MKFIFKPILIFSFCYQLGHPQCDSSYTYINDLPSLVTILAGGDSCFFDNDLDALNDIITANQLSYETPLHLGTQTWLSGRLRFFVAGNYWGGVESPLSILPESIGNLDDLRALYLEWNNLSILPESFYQLTNLMSLYISNNQIEEIGEGIGNLNNLYFLDLGYNQIPSIPDSFCNLENLTYWWMFNNELDQLPDCICSLNINWNDDDAGGYPYFAIGGNNLCVNIPDCIENSEYFHISLDQFYYTWPVTDSQNCDGLYNSYEFISPVDFNLSQPYPNPFNPETVITFEVSKKAYIQLEVFNIIGKKIATLQKGYFEPGLHKTIWNGQNHPSGIYLIRMKTEYYAQLRKVILMK
jgi:Leucine-rich repeat (LRR) protein